MSKMTDKALRRRRARRVHEARSADAQRTDEARTAKRVVDKTEEGLEEYAAAPADVDYPDVDTGPDFGRRRDEHEVKALERQASMAPVHGRPSLNPVTSIADIAFLAGYGFQGEEPRGGHDALEGIDAMVMGEVDSMRELHVGSATPGTPLDIAPEETIAMGFADPLALRPGEDVFGVASTDGVDEFADDVPDDEFDWMRWL